TPKIHWENFILGSLVLGGGYLFLKSQKTDWQRVLDWVNTQPAQDRQYAIDTFNRISDAEIADVWQLISNDLLEGVQMKRSDPRYNRIQAISTKYNIVT